MKPCDFCKRQKLIAAVLAALLITAVLPFNIAAAASLSKPTLRAGEPKKQKDDITFSLYVFSTDAVIYEKARLSAYKEATAKYPDEIIALSDGAWVLYPLVYRLEASFDNKSFYEVCCLPVEKENYEISLFHDVLSPLTKNGDFSNEIRNGCTVYLRLATAVDLFDSRQELSEPVPLSPIELEPLVYIRYVLSDGGVNSVYNPEFLFSPPENDINLLPPTKTGYRFVAWQGDGQLVKAGTRYHTAIAEWTPKAYKIRYVLTTRADYSFIHVNNTNNPTSILFGQTVELLPLTPPDGWHFMGFYTNAELKGTPVTSLTCLKEGDTVLYAEWLTHEEALRRQIKNEHWGDLNSDGSVTAADARLALRYAVNLEPMPAYALKRVDFYDQGLITAAHARTLLRVSVGLDDLLAILTACGKIKE